MVVALVLLVGCANLAGLILARNEQRRREAAVRLALGARGARLVRLFMIESLLLSLFGGLAGLAVAAWMLQVMSAFVIPGGVNVESLQLGLTGRVLLFAGGAALLTTLLTGLMPAVAASRVDVVSDDRAEGGVTTPSGSSSSWAHPLCELCKRRAYRGVQGREDRITAIPSTWKASNSSYRLIRRVVRRRVPRW